MVRLALPILMMLTLGRVAGVRANEGGAWSSVRHWR